MFGPMLDLCHDIAEQFQKDQVPKMKFQVTAGSEFEEISTHMSRNFIGAWSS